MAGFGCFTQDGFMLYRVSLWPALGLAVLPGLLLAASAMAAEAVPESAQPSPSAAPAAVTLAAPATAKNPDPWEKFNRGIFRFNDTADRYVLKPVAKGYQAITPEIVRIGITNFFSNLRSPLVVMNDLLQGKVKQAGGDTVRFVVNSTVGVVGLVDVAVRLNLPLHDEDFGQTLGVWGVPSGPYFVMPFFGPSSVRDASGFVVDAAANPRRRLIPDEADWILVGIDVVNTRASLLELEGIIQGDRYLFIRDLYLQRREYSVNDGQVGDDPFLDDPEEEEFTDPAEPAAEAAPSTPEAPDQPAEAAPVDGASTAPAEPVPGADQASLELENGPLPAADMTAASSAFAAAAESGI